MPDLNALLAAINGEDEQASWAAIGELVALRPTNWEERKARAYATCCMAEASFARNKVGTALDWWQETVDCDPMNATYRLAFAARGLITLGLNAQALNEVTRAINIDDKNPEAYHILGHVHLAMHNSDEAIAAFDKQIELAPDNPRAYTDRTNIALELADWDTVGKHTQKVIDMRGPQVGNAYHHLGMMAFRQGLHEVALELWDETLRHECDHREVVAWNYSNALLSLGRYREGWRKYEARGLQHRNVATAIQTHRGVAHMMWGNEPPPARLHVTQEMGFGDAMAMARYLPLLVEKGYDVRFEVHDSLVDLMRDSLPGVTVMPRPPLFPGLLGVPEFDYHIPALSLPRLFGTTVETIPWNGPYLKADPKKVAEYRQRLGGQKAVGVCWSAGIRNEHEIWLTEYGKRKSTSPKMWGQIVNAIYALHSRLVSLQVGPQRGEDIFGAILLDLLPAKPTWADTAALVECLDLVITVDTGLAHLVGAMGKPLWLMMHTEGSWHWMAERPGASWNDTSPWYPSARLFRAKKPHEWDDVIARIASELRLQAAA